MKSKNKAALSLNRQRMKKVSPERRKEIARNAARARWNNPAIVLKRLCVKEYGKKNVDTKSFDEASKNL